MVCSTALTALLSLLPGGEPQQQFVELIRKYEVGETLRYEVKGNLDTTLGRILLEGLYAQKTVKVEPSGDAEVEIVTESMMTILGNERQKQPIPPSRVLMDRFGSFKKSIGREEKDNIPNLTAFRYITYTGAKLELNKAIKVSQKNLAGDRVLFEGTQKLVQLSAVEATIESSFSVNTLEPKGKFKLKAKTVYGVEKGEIRSTDLEMTEIPISPSKGMSLEGAMLSMKLIK